MAASGRMMYASSVRGMKCSSTSKYLVNFSQHTLQHSTSRQPLDLLLVAVTFGNLHSVQRVLEKPFDTQQLDFLCQHVRLNRRPQGLLWRGLPSNGAARVTMPCNAAAL